ncbi:adenylyltransferase/cytidyltransferase family protein [bacterium]|nr:adenylyltransferase/cytidyltransferase family protein [candidate division CSSED10-310 bacterium]
MIDPDKLNCVITGRFEFLHKQNLAWIFKAKECCDNNAVLIQLLPGKQSWFLRDEKIRIAYLKTFSLNLFPVKYQKTQKQDTVRLPDQNELEVILETEISKRLNSKIFPSYDSLLPFLETLSGKRIVTTNGCFDILHPGHIALLKSSALKGDCLVVLINSDDSVRRFKSPERPIHDEKFRALVLSLLPFIDYVLIFNNDTPLKDMASIRPKIHVKGGSFIEERVSSERKLVESWGGELVTVPMLKDYSTSNILKCYRDRTYFP